ncbi:MAG: histidine phosphatase family protein [Acidobacteria bacterium]|nr:MAG: histidine phosphatase family protein [Acidobacteriota bacterium]
MADVIWLTRHGSRQDFVDADWHKTAERPHDPPLSAEGLVQAEQLAWRLEPEGITAVFSSPFLRCLQTAAPVANRLRLPIRVEPGFSEWLNPDWFPAPPQILPREAMVEHFPVVARDYSPQVHPTYPEDGETVLRRTAEAATGIAQAYPGTVLYVGHGATVYGSLYGLLGQSFAELERTLGAIHYCCLFRVERRNGAWVLGLCGDTSHLGEGKGGERFH